MAYKVIDRLRTSVAATVSDIKKQAISTKQINAIISSFIKGPQALLFLKHVEKITISQKKRTDSGIGGTLETLFGVELANIDEQTRKRREHLEDFAKSFDILKKQEEEEEETKKKAKVAVNTPSSTNNNNNKKTTARHRFDSDDEEDEELEEDIEEESEEEGNSKSRANRRKQKKQSTRGQVSGSRFVCSDLLFFIYEILLKFHSSSLVETTAKATT